MGKTTPSARVTGKGVRVSRTSKRPRVRAPRGSRQAEQLLTEAQVLEKLRLDQAAIDTLNACCSKRPPRNAASIVSAIKTRLEYSQPKPKQQVELDAGSRLAELLSAAMALPAAGTPAPNESPQPAPSAMGGAA